MLNTSLCGTYTSLCCLVHAAVMVTVCKHVLGDRGVFHHVMQQRGGQGLGIEMPLREDLGDGDRVGDIGVAGLPELPFVRGFAELIRAFKLYYVLRLEIAGCVPEQKLGFGHWGFSRDRWTSCVHRQVEGDWAEPPAVVVTRAVRPWS